MTSGLEYYKGLQPLRDRCLHSLLLELSDNGDLDELRSLAALLPGAESLQASAMAFDILATKTGSLEDLGQAISVTTQYLNEFGNKTTTKFQLCLKDLIFLLARKYMVTRQLTDLEDAIGQAKLMVNEAPHLHLDSISTGNCAGWIY